MLKYKIPNYKDLKITDIVLDFNGTLAYDGMIIESVKERLHILSGECNITVLTADTFGTVEDMFDCIDIKIEIIKTTNSRVYKRDYIKKLGVENVIAIGNGANDELMLKKAVLGILVVGSEGAATASLLSSDLIVKNIRDALDILIYPKRLTASLRK